MNAARLKDQVDPHRFTGKKFTRRQTFPGTSHDFAIKIDGIEAGRIMKKIVTGQRGVWFWTLTGPYFPSSKSSDGEEETFEAARDAFKKLFWEWHASALKQQGPATWYGAEE